VVNSGHKRSGHILHTSILLVIQSQSFLNKFNTELTVNARIGKTTARHKIRAPAIADHFLKFSASKNRPVSQNRPAMISPAAKIFK